MHTYDVLLQPLVTEKNTELQAQGKYVFQVAERANKPQIKQAVEEAFGVTVIGVNVLNVRGKIKRMGMRQFTGPSWKKAVITLQPGDKIELFEGV